MFERLFSISDVIDLTGTGGSSFCYFELHIPVENRTYLSMPFTVTQTDDFEYTGAEWSMLLRSEDDRNSWYLCEEYDFKDGRESNGVMTSTAPLSFDAFTVVPIYAPNGAGPFFVTYRPQDAKVGFKDHASAEAFVESIEDLND